MKAIKWALCTAAVLAAGCAPTPAPVNPQPPMTSTAQTPEDLLRQRVDTLQQIVGDLAVQSAQLPGHADADYRKAVVASFADLVRMLPILNGPSSSEQFAEQIRVIDSSRSQIQNAAADLSVDPTIDTGLRAVGRALADINRSAFEHNADIATTLQKLHDQLIDLDDAHGPEHRVVAANVIASSLQASQQMTAILRQHLPAQTPVTPAVAPAEPPATPASAPAEIPATAPASEPAATPTSAPVPIPPAAPNGVPTSAPISAPAASSIRNEINGLPATTNDQ